MDDGKVQMRPVGCLEGSTIEKPDLGLVDSALR